MTPAELIHAILLAPVDLLWNGGIGTYVKASTEDHLSIGDRANDAIRVDGKQLRVKVVGEGGNLGLSQLGRIEAAFCGVRVNTDAIDNSAGVDTSDHEVNIKILLGEVVRQGELTTEQRNELLASMTDDVAEHVLRDNYEQNVLLGNARAQEHSMVSVHERLIHWLEGRGDLDRGAGVPADRRRAREAGARRPGPEVAGVLGAGGLRQARAQAGHPRAARSPTTPTSSAPWPTTSRRRSASSTPRELPGHPLRREIVTNAVVNSMVNRGGITFAFRAQEEAGATPEQVTRAFVVCREVFGLADYVREVEALDNVVPTAAQTALYLEFRRLLDRSVRWFLTSRPSTLDIGAEIERFSGIVRDLRTQVPTLLRGEEKRRLERKAAELAKAGVPEELAVRAASLLDWYSLLDIVDIATDTGREPDRRRAAVLPGLGAVRHRRDARQGHPPAARRPLGRPGPWRAARRPVLGARVADPLGHRGRRRPTPSPPRSGRRGRRPTRSPCSAARPSLSAIRRLDHPNIAALSVALRTLRSVIRVGA